MQLASSLRVRTLLTNEALPGPPRRAVVGGRQRGSAGGAALLAQPHQRPQGRSAPLVRHRPRKQACCATTAR